MHFVDFSPTAIALGSSAIVKVSGQNSFRTLYGSLGQIHLGPPKGSAEGSAKVPPRFHQGSTKVPPSFSKFRGVSGSLGQIRPWAAKRFVLGCQKVLWKVPQGFIDVPPSFSKFRGVSGSLGQIRPWAAKRFVLGCQKVLWKVPQGFIDVPPSFSKFRGVSGSLGQIRPWAAKRFVLGCQKVLWKVPQGFIDVPPSFSKFRGVSGSLGQIRPWAAKRFILGCQKVLWKVPPRFHRGSTKVSPRLRKFRDRFSLPSLLYVCLPVPSTFFASFWTELALGSSAIVKVLGHNDTFFSRGSSEKVLWRVPPTILYISLPNGCYFIKSSLEGSANCGLHLPPSLLLGSKLREVLTCLNHTNPAPRKRPIISLLLGYSLGLFPSKEKCPTLFNYFGRLPFTTLQSFDPGRPMELIAFQFQLPSAIWQS